MPYQKKTILAILQELNNTIYLPAIQRKYVWKEDHGSGAHHLSDR